MAKTASQMRLYTLPSGCSFGDQLAKGLLARFQHAPEDLAKVRLLLPTRRACRTMQEAFLRQTGGKALLLPVMQPLGDVDEIELGIKTTGIGAMQLDLPRALPPWRRQIVLARMLQHVTQKDEDTDAHQKPFAYFFSLAESLAQLLDEMHTEGVPLSGFNQLVKDTELNQHWQISLKFLQALEQVWPDWLAQEKACDPAWRRRELMLSLNANWVQNPPDYPVIAAGTTGTIPATTALLKTILQLPQGEVILPGLDLDLDNKSWDCLQEGHPQFTLKLLLSNLRTTRDAVTIWPEAQDMPRRDSEHLWRDVMRPPETTPLWQRNQDNSNNPDMLQSIALCEADTPEQEALTIALAMRDVLRTPDKIAALVTPDRILANRVREALARWDIMLDDSAGCPLLQTAIGQFMDALLQVVLSDYAPINILRLLRHNHCALGLSHAASQALASILDSPLGYRSFSDKSPALPDAYHDLLLKMKPLHDAAKGLHAPPLLLRILLGVAEDIAATSERSGAENLWQGEAGEELAKLANDWLAAMDAMPHVTLYDFAALLVQLLQQASIRPSLAGTPRLRILGQLEARLQQADLMILGGLNEGIWPSEPAADPWLSRKMRRDLGLPIPERHLTLSAHDFVQAASAPSVLLTRSKRAADGNPTTASRWLQRLDAVCSLQSLPDPRENGDIWLFSARMLDEPETISHRTSEPKALPPLASRRHKLSISDIATWVADPYALYAKRILDLKNWPDIGGDDYTRLRGVHLHAILDQYTKALIAAPDTDPYHCFMQIAEHAGAPPNSTASQTIEWRLMVERVADFIGTLELTRRQNSWRPIAAEIAGQLTYAGLTIDGRAGRIDRNAHGEMAIIDYKARSSTYAVGELGSALRPQLGLEALMTENGQWTDLPSAAVNSLEYWFLGGKKGGEIKNACGDEQPVEDFVTLIKSGLCALHDSYWLDETQPYLSQPFGAKYANPDYAYLSRVAEWSLQGEEDDNFGEAA